MPPYSAALARATACPVYGVVTLLRWFWSGRCVSRQEVENDNNPEVGSMTTHDRDQLFAGSIPQLYDELLVPLIFDAHAADLAHRLTTRKVSALLEVAAGTGALTRALAARLPPSAAIIATDLNQPMLDRAAARGTARPVQWRQADAMQLPFADASFDAVVCQFGVMFFPDRVRAYAEARRVLRSGGVFLFNVWDRIENNEFAATVQQAIAALYPGDPPRFLARTPHGYFEAHVIRRDLAAGGFDTMAEIVTVPARSRSDSARGPAIAYCHGTPLRGELEARGSDALSRATDAAAAAMAQRFGQAAVDGLIQAHVVAVTK